jgi:predicted metalloprotease with PDZ domain
VALHRADDEIRQATGGTASLDDVARELAQRQGKVSLPLLQSIAQKVAGRRVQALERARLSASPGSPVR